MKYPNDLTREAMLEILEWGSRPPLSVRSGPYDDWLSNADEVNAWDERHAQMTDVQMRTELPEKETDELLLRMEVWTGEEFIAVSASWPLGLGAFLSTEQRTTIGDGPFWDGIKNPAQNALFHVSRSKTHGLYSQHPPADWLRWAKERGIALPEGLIEAVSTSQIPDHLSGHFERPLEKKEDPRIIKSLSRMIVAMAIEKYGLEHPTLSKNTVTNVSSAVAKAGLELGEDGVRDNLNRACVNAGRPDLQRTRVSKKSDKGQSQSD